MANEEKLNKINETASQRCTAALSKLIGAETGVVFSQPVITNVRKVSPLIGSQELGVGVFLPVAGGVTGSSLFLFPKETSFHLCDLLMKKKPRTIKKLIPFDEMVLKEVGNILLGNYLAVLSNSLKGEITEGMPKLSSGMFGAILEEVIAGFAKDSAEALVVRIELMVKAMSMKGYLLLIFKPEEVKVLLNAL
ncbi:MAG: chemotaxis protein CheC [Candidatus Omnitrophota bacterium]